jgi:hypothetical protein
MFPQLFPFNSHFLQLLALLKDFFVLILHFQHFLPRRQNRGLQVRNLPV